MRYGHLSEILKVSPGAFVDDDAELTIGRVDDSGSYSESSVSEVRIAFDYSGSESTPKARLIFVEE